MIDTTTQACMGGFCEHRTRCAAHVEFDRLHQEPSERKCQRGEEAPVATGRGITARDRILEALTAAGADGVAYQELLKLGNARGVEKALQIGKAEGEWFSDRQRVRATRYYLSEADMLSAKQVAQQAVAEALRVREARRKAKRVRVRQPSKPTSKPAAAPKQAAGSAAAGATKPPAIAKPQPNPEPRPTIIPPGLRVHRIPTPPSRYAVARVEPIFSGLPLGMYHPAESVLGRAYAQGGAL